MPTKASEQKVWIDSASNSIRVLLNGSALTQAGLGAAVDLKSHIGDISLGGVDTSIRIEGGSSSTPRATVPFHGEHIMYEDLQLVSEQETMEGYLACKWAVQSELPSSHPFKIECP